MRKGNQWLPEVFQLINLDPRFKLLPVKCSGGRGGVLVWSGYVGIEKFRQPYETDDRSAPQQAKSGKAPIKSIMPDVGEMLFYKLINNPLGTVMGLGNVKGNVNMADFPLLQRAQV